jgi:rod shape determining protein RodA
MDVIAQPRLRRNIDWLLLLAVVLLMGFSLLAIRCATASQTNSWMVVARQGAYFVVGLGLLAFVGTRDYRQISQASGILYGINVLLLVAVILFAPEVKGAARWIKLPIPGLDFKIQPSEFAKIITIITLSTYVVRIGPRIREFPRLMLSLAHIIIPMGLIMKQPDLGTSLVLGAIWLGIVFMAGANPRHLILMGVVSVALFAAAWKFDIVKTYQKERVLTFLNPMHDPRGDGYHILQSMKAIGSGQVTGQGIGKGVMTNLDYVPENHTDFIFTAVGEELGFVGCVLLLACYALLLFRGVGIIAASEDPLGRLMATGVVTLFAFHLFVNMGMTMGIMPVVGVPLPLMSFGGSAAWMNLMCVGLLLSVSLRRHKIQF